MAPYSLFECIGTIMNANCSQLHVMSFYHDLKKQELMMVVILAGYSVLDRVITKIYNCSLKLFL
jgi:hypothetical protein